MDILKLSTRLQADLIRVLDPEVELSHMLTTVVERTTEALKAGACTIFLIYPAGVTATQLAGTGYQAGSLYG